MREPGKAAGLEQAAMTAEGAEMGRVRCGGRSGASLWGRLSVRDPGQLEQESVTPSSGSAS
jgi:hypothetical protein